MTTHNQSSQKRDLTPHPYQSLIVLFDDYEIHGVRRFGRGKSRHCEQVPDEAAQFWSLFGHATGEGLHCIGDFDCREAAEAVYARITGHFYSQRTTKKGITL